MYFLDAAGRYYETLTDVPAPPGHRVVPQRPEPWAEWTGSSWLVGAPPEPSAQEKDQIAEEAEFEFAEQNPVTAAIALMLADMRRAANPGLSRAAALAQTRAAFRAAFRDVLDRTGP